MANRGFQFEADWSSKMGTEPPESYRKKIDDMIAKAREWRMNHEEEEVVITFGYPSNVLVITTFFDAIKRGWVKSNEAGGRMLKHMGALEDDNAAPTLAMVEIAVDYSIWAPSEMDEPTRSKLDGLKKYAEGNIFTFEMIKNVVKGLAQPAGDDNHYCCVFTIEKHFDDHFRHLSISEDGPEGTIPAKDLVRTIASYMGIRTGPKNFVANWVEKTTSGVLAMNIVQPLDESLEKEFSLKETDASKIDHEKPEP